MDKELPTNHICKAGGAKPLALCGPHILARAGLRAVIRGEATRALRRAA